MQKLIKITLLFLIFLGLFSRLWQFGSNPSSLYWDEVAIGLDARSISQTNLDINGNSPWQTMFYSYGDYKAPVYIWLTAALAKLLPVNQALVRLPSLIASLLTGLILFKLTKLLFPKKSLIPLLVLTTYSLMPWSVHFSRIGMESHLSLFFLTLSVYLTVLAKLKKKPWLLLLSSMSISVGIFTYISLRVVGPLLFLTSFILFHQKTKKVFSIFGLGVLVILFSSLILVRSPQYKDSQAYRLSNSNLLTSTTHIDKSLAAKGETTTISSRLFHHRYLYKAEQYLDNYLSHFSAQFLLFSGDSNLRHHTDYNGQLLIVQGIILLIGMYYLITLPQQSAKWLILAWLFISPAISSLVNEVPHASRSIYMIIPLAIIVGLGLSRLKPKLLLLALFITLVNFSFYLHDYFTHYPSRSNMAWINPYQKAALYLKNNPTDKDIYVTNQFYQPNLYFQFYAQKSIKELGSTCPQDAICIADPDWQPENTKIIEEIPGTDKLVIKQKHVKEK